MATIFRSGYGDWSDMADWYGHAVPTAADDAVFQGNALYAGITGVAQAAGLSLADGSGIGVGQGGTLTVGDGGIALASSAWLQIVGTGTTATTTGTLTLDDASVAVMLGEEGSASDVTLSASALDSRGTIQLHAAGGSHARLLVSGAAGFGTAGVLTGSVLLDGASTIAFGSGQITAIAGDLTLSGAQATITSGEVAGNSALTGLTSLAGTLTLTGLALTLTGDLDVDGALQLGSSDPVASMRATTDLTVAGTLTGNGIVQILGTAANGAATLTVGGLAHTGFVAITGTANAAAMLVDTGAAPATLTGSLLLTDHASVHLASGTIAQIAQGSTVTLSDATSFVSSEADTASNSGLAGLSVVAGALTLNGGGLAITGDLGNSGTIRLNNGSDPDTGAATALAATIAGTLTNSGILSLMADGSYGSGSVGLAVAGIDNTPDGNIMIAGNADTGDTAILAVASAAPAALDGLWQVGANGSVVFASGGIADIVASGQLVLSSASAVFANAADTASNSALSSLASIEGVLAIASGSVVLGGALNNSGGIYLATGSSGPGTAPDTASLSIAGVLTNSGTITIGGDNSAATLTTGGLINTGSLSVTANVAMAINGLLVNDGVMDLTLAQRLDLTGVTALTLGAQASTMLGLAQDGPLVSDTLAIDGGTLTVDAGGVPLNAGDRFTIFSFGAGSANGLFDTFSLSSIGAGIGGYVQHGDLLIGLVYEDHAGRIEMVVAEAPASTADSFATSGGAWEDIAKWTQGAPAFYAQASIAHAAVTLSSDATVSTLALTDGATLGVGVLSDLSVTGALTVGEGTRLTVTGGALASAGTQQVDGHLILTGGAQAFLHGTLYGGGTIALAGSAVLHVEGSVAAGLTIDFGAAGVGDEMILTTPGAFDGTIAGFAPGDTLDLAGIAGAHLVLGAGTQGGTQLLVEDGAGTVLVTLAFEGAYGLSSFTLTQDGAGGSLLSLAGNQPSPLTIGAVSNTVVESGAGVAGIATGTALATATDASFVLTGFTHIGGTVWSEQGTYGTLMLDTATGGLTYTLDNASAATNALSGGAITADRFTIAVTDTHGLTTSQAVSFAITGTNDAPVVADKTQAVAYNGSAAMTAAALLVGASDAEGDALSVVGASGAQHGTLSMDADGTVHYSAFQAYVGADSYQVVVSDSHGATQVETVKVTVSGATTAAATTTPAYVWAGASTTGQVFDVSGDGLGHRLYATGGDDTIHGGNGGDALNGGAGNDIIYGGDGKDTLTGGAGADRVWGGAGADTFVFRPGDMADPALTGGLYDEIMDFSGAGNGYRPGEDMLVFSGFSSAATLTYDVAATQAASDATAHYYTVTDGAWHGDIIVHYTGNAVLQLGDYGFL